MSDTRIQTRDDGVLDVVDIDTRMMSVRVASVDEKERSVEATLSSDSAVEMYDWRAGEVIDEVLLNDGVQLPRQMPLLAAHNRFSLSDVLGSVRSIRTEEADGGKQLVGRLHFAEGDDDAERAWNKVRQGHLTDVSIGYRVLESTELAKGQSATIGGREFKAKTRPMRIATKWRMHEASIVPIGADQKAKTRAKQDQQDPIQGAISMNEELRKYLESIGLRSGATDSEAWQFLSQLEGEQMTRAQQLVLGVEQREESDEDEDNETRDDTTASNPDEAAERAVAAERERVRRINELAGEDVPEAVRERAINDGLSVAEASPIFLAALRDGRQGPAIHSRSHEAECTVESLSAGFMVRNGLDPVENHVRYIDGCYVARRNERQTQQLEQAAERGWQYRDLSLVDICRESLRISGQRIPGSRGEMIRAAMSGSTLTNIFSTTFSASLLSGYTEAADSTMGWTGEADVPNFQTNERTAMGKVGQLTKHGRGGTADHVATSDEMEQYKIARYSGQFVVDEMDIIDDRFGAIEQTTPVEMGNSARALRPDLVFAIMLANGAMSDTGNLYNSTAITTAGGHANLTTAALATTALQAAIADMMQQRISGRPLNIRPRYLVVPPDLWATAQILTASQFRTSSDGEVNPLADLMLEVRVDDRCGAAGVTDPASGTAYTGSTTNWFLFARPGEGGAKTIEVGYLRGTGRAPQIRSFVLTQGQWGIGFDVNMDIGAKALDWRATHKSTGAG